MHPRRTLPPERRPAGGHIARRDLLALTALAVVAGACGDDEPSADSDGSVGTPSYALEAAFPRNGHVVVGAPQRLPFLVVVVGDAPVDRIDGPVTFEVTREDGTPVGDPVEVEPRGVGLPRAYLPLDVTFTEPGFHYATATYKGQELQTTFDVVVGTDLPLPQVGAPLPPVATPLTTDPRGVAPICTRDPQCPFHEYDLVTALGAGKPTLLLVSTPLYCATNICGPVLDVVMEIAADADLSVVHAEVYANPEEVESIAQARPAPIVEAYGMTFEPSLFVTDAAGTLVRRLDVVFDRDEVQEAIALAS